MEILRRRHGEMETWRYGYIETLIWTHGIKILGNSEVLQRNKGKKEARQFSLIHLPIAHRVNRSVISLLFVDEEQMEVIYLQTA